MKFLVIFISLLMVLFGGIFSYVCSQQKEAIKSKANYESLETLEKITFDLFLEKTEQICFVCFLIGICLFIAGLFI